MVGILTPSTGKVRDGGDINFNSRKFAAGDRILYRADDFVKAVGGWRIGNVLSVDGLGAMVEDTGFVQYRRIAGAMKPSADRIDEEALLQNLKALQDRGDKAIELARRQRYDAVMALLEGGGVLDKVPPYLPE